MPLTDGGPNGLGNPLTEKGDCMTDPPADNGVPADKEPETGLPNAGTGGICTRRSGDLCFIDAIDNGLTTGFVVDGASVMAISLELTTVAGLLSGPLDETGDDKDNP